MDKKLTVLDCTLRDGGYYNNWQFNLKDVNNYLKQVYSSGIDVVEIGFYFFEKDKNYGDFAFVDKKILKKIIKSKNTELAVMINGSDLLKIKGNYISVLNKVFKKKKLDFSIIRIAAHYGSVFKLIRFIKHLKYLGYKICLNLMQVNTIKTIELKKCLKQLKLSQSVDVFYFADSFGNLNPKKIKKICKTIKENWHKEIGIHSHDNCGMALKNSIQAFKSGVTWIDGTIQGMGRGAGNVKTESLLNYFKKLKYKPKTIKKISSLYFSNLKKRYKWGSSKFYKFAANFNIHPSYVQELCKDNRYTKKEIENMIIHLSKINAKSYDPKILGKFHFMRKKTEGKWNAKDWCSNRTILLLGQGPSLKNKKNINMLEKFIVKNKPLVLSININNYVPKEFIDCYVTCNETRMLVDHKNYEKLNKTFILPLKKLRSFTNIKNNNNFLDYGIEIKNNKFKCFKNYTVLPSNQSFGYAAALSIIGGTSKLILAGFDGYQKDHLFHLEMEKIIKLIKGKYPKIKLNTLTKSNYNLKRLNV